MCRGLNVFNAKRDLAGGDASAAVMVQHTANSAVVLALLSPKFFDSKFTRLEVEGAFAVKVPVIPVYSAEDCKTSSRTTCTRAFRQHNFENKKKHSCV